MFVMDPSNISYRSVRKALDFISNIPSLSLYSCQHKIQITQPNKNAFTPIYFLSLQIYINSYNIAAAFCA